MESFADDFVPPAAPSPATPTPVRRRKPLGSISTNANVDATEVSKPLAMVKAAAAVVTAVAKPTTVKVWENGDGDACYLVNSTPQGSVAVYKCDHGCGFQGSFADVAEHELSSCEMREAAAPRPPAQPAVASCPPCPPAVAPPTPPRAPVLLAVRAPAPAAARRPVSPRAASPPPKPAGDRRVLAVVFALSLSFLFGAHPMLAPAAAPRPPPLLAPPAAAEALGEPFASDEAIVDACLALVASDPPAAYAALRATGVHGAFAALRRAVAGVARALRAAFRLFPRPSARS